MTDWYFRKDGKKCGPFNTTSLKKLARTGNLQPSDMIWRKGLSKWVPASKAKGLFDSGNIETNTDYDCPSASRIARNELSKSKATGISSEAKIIIALVSLVTLVIGPFLLWVFVFRDTWEIDNWGKISQMSDSVQQLIWNNKLEEGVAKYDELLAFIGDRELKQDALRRDLQEAKEIAEPVRRKVNEAKNLERLRSLEERAKAFAESGEIRRAVEAYREALDLIRKADSENPKFANAIRRISRPKQQLEKQLAAAQQRREEERKRREQEAYDKEMASKGYVRHKGQWLTREEYAKLGKLRVTATYFYNDFKGNVPNVAAVFAIPKEKGLQGKKIPGNYFFSLKTNQDQLKKFMDDIGGAFGWAGGDGKVELRLEPGSYEVLVLMDVRPYLSSDLHKVILAYWFSPKFAQLHGGLGRYATKTVEVYPNDTTEISLNLK